MKKIYFLLCSRKLLSTLLIMWVVGLSYSQVSGIVTNENGEPLTGATIRVEDSSAGTISGIDGSYSLEAGPDDNLSYSFVGYLEQIVPVNGRTEINIQLELDDTSIDQIVVIGYGTIEKKDATGAVDVLDDKNFNKGLNTNPDDLIKGRVAGVQITGASGEPGAPSNIRIRGAGSIRSGNGPLVVVDGVPLDGRGVGPGSDIGAGSQGGRNPLNFINPNDIASISVLKDASATAIYGSRGANGVIIIETKKGAGAPTIDFSTNLSFGAMPSGREYDLLSASEYIAAGGGNQGTAAVNGFDEIIRNSFSQNHTLSYGASNESGGDYRVSLSLQDQEGIIQSTSQTKYTGSININQEALNGRLKLGARILASFINDEDAPLSDNVGAEGDLMISALRWNPTRPFANSDGTWNQPSDNERNPLAFLDYYSDNTETGRTFGNLSAEFEIIDGLSYRFNYGIDRSEAIRRVAASRAMLTNFTSGTGVAVVEELTGNTQLFEHYLTFDRNLNEGLALNALAGFSYQEFNRKGNTQRGSNFLIDDQEEYLNNLNYASAFPANQNSSFKDVTDELQSFFGRVNFDIIDRYLVTATMRADGSSRFGDGNKYGYFPSAAVAWKIGEEDFAPEGFDDFKIRLGWGITGNQEFPSDARFQLFSPNGDGSGITQSQAGNDDLKWEETTQFNVGLDYGFWNNRLSGSIDWYKKNTQDLLFRVSTAQPGPASFIWRNLDGVEVENTGVEFSVNAIAVEKDDLFGEVGLNIATLNNELSNISSVFPNGIITGNINGQGLSNQRSQMLYDGQSLYAFYLSIFEGFDANGIGQYADINGDGFNTASGITPPGTGDRTFVGSPLPDLNLGFRTTWEYKDFDFSAFLNGEFGHKIFNNTALALFSRAALNGGANVDRSVLDSPQSGGDSPIPSTRFIEDGDYIRLANATLGYSFSNHLPTWTKNLRLTLTGQNLFVITDYTGFDPEVNTNKEIDGVPSFGIDYSSYPRARVISVGLNLGL